MDIRVSDNFVQHIKNNKKLYLGTDIIRPRVIATYIADDALILGATQAIIWQHSPWFLVAADIDWLSIGHSHKFETLFEKLIALKGGGQNAFRREPILMAFADNVFISDANYHPIIIKGKFEKAILEKFISYNQESRIRRVVGFSCLVE